MREIEFRGKHLDSGTWLYGAYHTYYDSKRKEQVHHIYSTAFDKFVDGDTVGQYTGLTDKNGTKIFEGDILRDPDGEMSVIEFNRYGWDWGVGLTGFVAVQIYDWGLDDSMQQEGKDLFREANRNFYPEETEIVGNVWENPELLKGEQK